MWQLICTTEGAIHFSAAVQHMAYMLLINVAIYLQPTGSLNLFHYEK
jgi:hypothetical protein